MMEAMISLLHLLLLQCREPNSDLQDLRKEFTDFKTDCKTKFIQQEKTNVQTEKEVN